MNKQIYVKADLELPDKTSLPLQLFTEHLAWMNLGATNYDIDAIEETLLETQISVTYDKISNKVTNVTKV